jgi:hypothetical protein
VRRHLYNGAYLPRFWQGDCAIFYRHPSYEGFQYELGLLVELMAETTSLKRLDVKTLATATDAWLGEQLNKVSTHNVFNELTTRAFAEGRRVFQTYSQGSASNVKYKFISSGSERELLKDGNRVWLIDKLPNDQISVVSWDDHSLVAKNLKPVKHTPSIWWENKKLDERIQEIRSSEEAKARKA